MRKRGGERRQKPPKQSRSGGNLAWLGIARQPYTKRLGINTFLMYLRIKGLSVSVSSGTSEQHGAQHSSIFSN